MSSCSARDSSWWRGTTLWTMVLVGPVVLGAACASAPEPEVEAEDIESVEDRVESVERTNGRLSVRVEEMERQMALLQDRVESNRIALQRQGYLRQQGDRFARAPQPEQQQQQRQRPEPAPESHYQGRQQQSEQDDDYTADPTMQQRMDDRGYHRIPLSDQQSGHDQAPRQQRQQRRGDETDHQTVTPEADDVGVDSAESESSDPEDQEAIVITNETIEQQFGSGGTATNPDPADPSSADDEGGEPEKHVPVTSETLPTSDELEDGGDAVGEVDEPTVESETDSEVENPVDIDAARWMDASDDELLDLYQDSLAEYRNGDYAEALEGFNQFYEAGPREDYVDNALYWIGECHYGLGEYHTSIDYFQRILDEMPAAGKVPDAMLKMSLAYKRLGEPDEALALLEELVEQYPNTNPGQLGQERLAEFEEQSE